MPKPDDVKAYEEGCRLFKEGRLLEALRQFKLAAESGEDRPMEHFALASAQMQVGDLDEAERQYRRFLEMSPGKAAQEKAARKALLHIEHEHARRASKQRGEELERVTKLYEEAASYFRCGGYDSARERLLTLAESWGRSPEVLNLLALCHRHTGKAAEAEALFREALDKAPDNADLLLNLAVTCFERGVEQARPLLARVVSAQPRNGKAWHNLAVMALATGRYEEAAGAWRKAVLADPNDETARANLDMLERRLP